MKSKAPSIQFYLIAGNILLVLLAIAIVGNVWSSQHEDAVEDVLREQVRRQAGLIAKLMADQIAEQFAVNPNPDQVSLPEANIEESTIVVYISPDKKVWNLGRTPLTREQADYIAIYSQQALKGQSRTTDIYSTDGKQESIYSAIAVRDSKGQITGAVCLILPLDVLERDFADIRATFYEAIALVALVGLLLSFALTFLISHHVSEAKQMAEMVSEGDYHLRVAENGPSEFRELAGHLNRMAAQLEEQTKQRQTLLANVSHELARPLGGLRIGIESLQGGAIKDTALTADLLENMHETVQRMEFLLDDITLAAHPKTKPVELNITRIDLPKLMKQLMTRHHLRAEQLDVKLVTKLPKNLPVLYADEKRLNQILGNLIDNALKFTAREQQVVLSVKKNGDEIQILVHDSGTGIPEQDLPHIFSPFYQGQPSKMIRQGMGLGLAISRQLAELHGGTLELFNDPSGGALAILTLPRRSNNAKKHLK